MCPNWKRLVSGMIHCIEHFTRLIVWFKQSIGKGFVLYFHFNIFWKFWLANFQLTVLLSNINSIVKYSNTLLFLAGITVKFSSRRNESCETETFAFLKWLPMLFICSNLYLRPVFHWTIIASCKRKLVKRKYRFSGFPLWIPAFIIALP